MIVGSLQLGHSIPIEDAESVPGFGALLTTLYTYLTLIITPAALLCQQMFLPWCQFIHFSYLERVFFLRKLIKRRERLRVAAAALPRERERESSERIAALERHRNTRQRAKATVPLYLPHLWCVVSEQRRRTTGIPMANVHEDMCWVRTQMQMCFETA